MGYTVKVEHPHFPEGEIFNVGGLDRVPNGGTLEVDDEMERLFVMSHGQTLEDAFANDAIVSLSGSSALDKDELDSLLEAYAPQPEETATEETVDEEPPPTWMQSANKTTDDEGGEE